MSKAVKTAKNIKERIIRKIRKRTMPPYQLAGDRQSYPQKMWSTLLITCL